MSHVQAVSNELEKSLKTDGSYVATGEISKLLGGVVARLQVLKRKAQESIAEELQAGMVCKRRLDHLKDHANTSPSAVNQWRRQRLDRMLVEYFLRKGYYKTATKLADSSELRDLTNIGRLIQCTYHISLILPERVIYQLLKLYPESITS